MKDQLRTLVVDDEEGIRFFLTETLQRAGHLVATATSGEEALDQLRNDPYDLILLDLKLGGRVDGLRVLESVRWRWPRTVVIILTAHGSMSSALSAIREGVDGYLLKPVEPEDVRRAVEEALERRRKLGASEGPEPEERTIERGPFSVDLEKHQARLDGRVLDLTPREFTLLIHLMQTAPQVVSPVELVRVVRQYEPEHVYEAREIIKWYVHRLRHKVEPDPANPQYILNVRGVGYRFAA